MMFFILSKTNKHIASETNNFGHLRTSFFRMTDVASRKLTLATQLQRAPLEDLTARIKRSANVQSSHHIFLSYHSFDVCLCGVQKAFVCLVMLFFLYHDNKPKQACPGVFRARTLRDDVIPYLHLPCAA